MKAASINIHDKNAHSPIAVWAILLLLSALNAVIFGFAELQQTPETMLTISWFYLLHSHITHTDWLHLVSNIIALRLLIEIFPLRLADQFVALLTAICSINLLLIFSDVYSYAGLSGIIYGIPGLYVGIQMTQKKWGYAAAMTAIFLLYILLISPLDVMSSNKDYVPFEAAHIVGYFSALLVGFYFKPTKFCEDKA